MYLYVWKNLPHIDLQVKFSQFSFSVHNHVLRSANTKIAQKLMEKQMSLLYSRYYIIFIPTLCYHNVICLQYRADLLIYTTLLSELPASRLYRNRPISCLTHTEKTTVTAIPIHLF